ncbi:uncharacterized protein [Blastocystis hominis]|uniref:Box C/D snoRNA protein 1 n=1 Tax=Blastocystis hominis TaxID=12968 RepID=D8M4K4_BLAHO|nr:uncharacterized protein [Blastocystis hominis]CBK22993.2 unnamed protein product [Blastocystis hominis]|eukprot:XP_012897041.1 uncharacterized protein [Blastocystis hominis]
MESEDRQTESAPLCEVCHQHPAKYTCPGCKKRTCSLQCVRKHKETDKCSGIRNRTRFVSLSNYNDETAR